MSASTVAHGPGYGPAIRVNGLGLRYRSMFGAATWALRDCTFALPPGRVAALVGSNGAGKTQCR